MLQDRGAGCLKQVTLAPPTLTELSPHWLPLTNRRFWGGICALSDIIQRHEQQPITDECLAPQSLMSVWAFLWFCVSFLTEIDGTGLFQGSVLTPPSSRRSSSDICPFVKTGESSDLIRHFLIESSAKGVRIKGSSQEPYFGESLSAYKHSEFTCMFNESCSDSEGSHLWGFEWTFRCHHKCVCPESANQKTSHLKL